MSTARSRRTRNIRIKARRRLTRLLKEQDNKCYYCKCDIFSKENIIERVGLKNLLLTTDMDYIYFIENFKINKVKRATIEHLKPIGNGGNNNDENLAVCCSFCNRKMDLINRNKKG